MIAITFIALLAPAQSSATSLSVGAMVVRPEPQPSIAVVSGAVAVSNAGSATVTVEGGTPRRANGGTILITPGSAGRMRITLTY